MIFERKPYRVEAYIFYKDLSGGDPPKWFAKALVEGVIGTTESNDNFYFNDKNVIRDVPYGAVIIKYESGELGVCNRDEFLMKYKRIKNEVSE